VRILGISGSLRADSLNTALLRAAAAELPDAAELVILDGLREIPAFDQDADRSAPPGVARLREELTASDALLIATPEYNSSIPGWLKNALDWVSRPLATSPLRFLPTAVVGASTGAFGAVWAQAELRKVLAASGARVVPGELAVGHAHERLGPDGALDPALREPLRELLGRLVDEARARSEARAA
jgi:chromate reductase, NAD(P)H dehydrogenase (quinone)